LDREWLKNAFDNNLPLTEIKPENTIDRIKGTARDPRFIERVPADAEFAFAVTFKQMENDDDLEQVLLEGLKLLEMDSIGSSGSRGYGKIAFEFSNSEIMERFNSIEPF
jgi:CRISPR-associated protein Csm3